MRSTLWVVMEFCRVGSTLDVMRRQGNPLSEPQSAWVIRGMLYALDYMHTERRAIHRDIKAANVLLSRTGEVPHALCNPVQPSLCSSRCLPARTRTRTRTP